MPKYVRFDGQLHSFPDDFTDGQITVALRQESGLTPRGDKVSKPQDAPGFDAAQPGIVSDTLSGMGRTVAPSMAAEDRKVSRGTLPAVGKATGAALGVAGEGLSLGMDAAGIGKPQQRVEQAIDLFAQPGKTPLENLKYAGGRLAGAARKTYDDASNPDGTGMSSALLGIPVMAAKFTGNLLDSVDDGRRPDPTGESFVQKRQRYIDAARRVASAKSQGLPVDPADRDLYARAKAGLLPTAEADPSTGLIAEPMPDRPGGIAESAVRAVAKTPAAIAETFSAPGNAAIMGGTKGAMALASRLLPPPAALAAQMAIGAGTTGYFLNDMSKGAGESVGRVAGGDFDQRFIENEGPNALANVAFVGHMGATSAKPIAQSVEGMRASGLSAKTAELYNASLQTAVEKVTANRAAGTSIFSGLNKNEVAAYTRAQEAIAKANAEQGNDIPAEPLARDNSVDDAVQIVKQMYGDRPDLKVSIAETAADLPAGLLPVNDTSGTVKAVFNPETSEVHVVRDRITSAAELAQKLAHERDHGTTDIPAHQVAGFAEKAMKAELAKLVQEERLDPAEFERLSRLTGEAFSGEVKRIAADRNHPAQIAADEVMAGMAEQMPAQPGRFAQGFATLASKIPGVQLTEMDARALAAKQAAARTQPFQPNRPVETLGEAPQLPPVDRRPVQPVEAEPVVEPAPVPVESFVGREVTVGGKKAKIIADDGSGKFVIQPEKGEPRIWTPDKNHHPSAPQKGERAALPDGSEGVIYSTDKTSAAIRFDDGTSKIVPRKGLRRVEQPVASEPQAPQPEPQAAAEAAPVPVEHEEEVRESLEQRPQPEPQAAAEAAPVPSMLDRRAHAEIQAEKSGRRWSDMTDQERLSAGYQSDLTGLPNKRHFDDHIDSEGGRKYRPDALYYDMDDFKALNTKFLEANVDKHILPVVGDTIKEVLSDPRFKDAVDIAHVHGDEFYGRAKSPALAAEALEMLNEKLKDLEFDIEVNGKMVHHKGLGGSYGVGPTIEAATAAAKQHKLERRAAGLRTGERDAKPVEPPAGVEAPSGEVARASDLATSGEPGTVNPEAASQPSARYSRDPGKAQLYDAAAEFARKSEEDGVYPDIFAIAKALDVSPAISKGLYDELRANGVVGPRVDFSGGQATRPVEPKAPAKPTPPNVGKYVEFKTRDGKTVRGSVTNIDTFDKMVRVTDRAGNHHWKEYDEVREVGGDAPAKYYSRKPDGPAPSKHDQLIKPIMGDLVELASAMIADKSNKIRTPEDLVDAMSQHVGAVLAKGIEKEAKVIFAEASKDPEARDKSLVSVKKAMESGLAPAKKLSISNDEATSRLQLAVDRAREDGHITDVKKDSQTLRNGAQLYANLGRDGVVNLVVERAKQTGGKLSDDEIVAAKIAMDDGAAHQAAAKDPALYLRQLAFANAFRITATEAGRGLRLYRWDINDPTDVRVKRELHDIFTAALERNPEKLTLDDAAKQLKKLRTFLEKNVGVPDVESIPIEVLTDQAKVVGLVREWSAVNATMGMKVRTWCMNSLVSAFKTHVANVEGNAGNMAVEYTMHRQLEARLNQLLGVDGIRPSDLAGITSQMIKAQSMALRDAANYAKTGRNELEQKVYGSDWVSQLRKQKRSFSATSKNPVEWAGDKLQYVGRALGTEDAYFTSLAGHIEALAAARMYARRIMRRETGSDGVGTKEYNDIVDRELTDYASDSWRRGIDRAEYLTFKNETSNGLKTLLAVRRKHPWLSPLAWFLTTPWNLISRGAEFAPGIGLINRGVFKGGEDFSPGDPMYKESKPEIRTRVAAAQIIGLLATAVIASTKASMFSDDGDEPFITGSEPPQSFDKGEREARRRSLPPYTVKNFLNVFDPDERISYRRLDPMATSLGLTVDIVDMFRDYAQTGSLDRLASKAKSATVGQFVDKPFLQGASDVIRMVQDGPTKKSPIEYALGLLGNFYPRFLQQFPMALDDKVRETRNYGATKQQEGQSEAARMLKTAAYRATGFPSLPFIGQLAEPRVNLGGEEVGKTGSPLYRGIVPMDRYGDEVISPEARRLDLNYINSVPHLAEDAPNYPTEADPGLSFGGENFKMFPQDWAESEKTGGAMFLDLAKKAGFTEKRGKPFSPEELDALNAFAQTGRGVARAKMVPRYWSPK